MSPILRPPDLSGRSQYEAKSFERDEIYRFYVSQRRTHCNWLELMDLSLIVPYCSTCALDDPSVLRSTPDILPGSWRNDLGHQLGEEGRARILTELQHNSGFAFRCWRRGERLRPWQRDDVHVIRVHVEEHFSTPLYEPDREGQVEVAKVVQNEVFDLYGRECFRIGCGRTSDLEIDHIQPRNHGGTAAFRNLQPLCGDCNREKDDRQPSVVEVVSTAYFGPYPDDSYEGLFWTV